VESLRTPWLEATERLEPGVEIIRALDVEQGNPCGEGCAYGQGLQLGEPKGPDTGATVPAKWCSSRPDPSWPPTAAGGSSVRELM